MITAERFWEKLDEIRSGIAWKYLFRNIGVKYTTLMGHKEQGKFPSFEVAVRICLELNIDLDYFLEIDTKQYLFCDYISQNRLHLNAPFGELYWNIINEYRKDQYITWAIVCEKINMKRSTLSTLKTQQKTLPVDTTVSLLEILNIPLDYFVKLLAYDRENLMGEIDKKSEISIVRNEIGRMLREIKNVEDLKGIRDFISYTLDKRKKEENSW